MEERFLKDDLGKIVSLTVDVRNNDESCYQRDSDGLLKVEYGAIVEHEFVPQICIVSDEDRVRITGKTLEKIDTMKVAKRLGVDYIETLGEIVELDEKYVKLRSVKRRRNYLF
ncbi:MAG: hypothetical protein KKA62_01110 [Nanoarchaeota archaeon]|nr:hypothetical protein [Nanoarchaeota archaeon]MBU1644458.1 hypothetical protein [Nanoarchaeota archaeon]MBU1976534.1 hypothetical protein [Nanoarchaeota archaeon]